MSGETNQLYREIFTGDGSSAMQEEHSRFFSLPTHETQEEAQCRNRKLGEK